MKFFNIALLVLGMSAVGAFASAQTITTITYSGTSQPVPEPVVSLTPVAGFRHYDSLQARYTALSLDKDYISMSSTGNTIDGNPIYSYLFSTSDLLTPEGLEKPGAVIEGSIHAREWAGTESAASLFEWLAENGDNASLAQYLLENMELSLHPIASPDSFAVTQDYYNKTISGSTSGSGGRDGRMRRKSLRDTDGVLGTLGDYDRGVDLNRNHFYGFGGGSSSPTSITYYGTAPGSEPESQALYGAAALVDEQRLRFFVDIHSYGQLYYAISDESNTRSTAVFSCVDAMRGASFAITGRTYRSIETVLATGSVGATDEYFTGTYRAMSYTLECRPTGGNGFILPDNEVEDLKSEILPALQAGLYYSAGPAALTSLNIYDITDGMDASSPLVFTEIREYNPTLEAREQMLPTHLLTMETGREYVAVLRFNKPLRWVNPGTGAAEAFPGSVVQTPSVALNGVVAGGNLQFATTQDNPPFSYGRYQGDTLLVDLDLTGSDVPTGDYSLVVSADDMLGTAIDGNPLTVADWSDEGWVSVESGVDSLSSVPITNTLLSSGDVWFYY